MCFVSCDYSIEYTLVYKKGGEIDMKTMSVAEMQNVNAGATYASCPVCGYRRKLDWTEWILGKKLGIKRAEYLLSVQHQKIGKPFNWSSSVHR